MTELHGIEPGFEEHKLYRLSNEELIDLRRDMVATGLQDDWSATDYDLVLEKIADRLEQTIIDVEERAYADLDTIAVLAEFALDEIQTEQLDEAKKSIEAIESVASAWDIPDCDT